MEKWYLESNDLLDSEEFKKEFLKSVSVREDMAVITEAFYNKYKNEKWEDPILLDFIKENQCATVGIYSEREFPMIHVTNYATAISIKDDGKLLASKYKYDKDGFEINFLSSGEGIYCFDLRTCREFKGDVAIYGNVKVPHIRIIDYCDGIKPIGEHILLVDYIPLTNLNVLSGEEQIKRFRESHIGTVDEIIDIYGLTYNSVNEYLLSIGHAISGITNTELVDIMPEMLLSMKQ